MKLILGCAILVFISCALQAQTTNPVQNTPDLTAGDSLLLGSGMFENEVIGKTIFEAGAFNTTAFVNADGTHLHYLLNSAKIVLFNSSEKKIIHLWDLPNDNGCDGNESCQDRWWSGRWSADELLEEQTIGSFPPNFGWKELYSEVSRVDFMGCMQHKPLRYGDINGDGSKELVVLLPNLYSVDWLIFSTTLNKTIFASKLDYNDVVANADLASNPLSTDLIAPIPQERRYQYWSRWAADQNRSTAMDQGLRSFAKLYFGDFDKDGSFDILVWRKMYESRLVTDPVAGFELKSELFGHYELVNGEYRLQQTEPATIEGWLAAKQLTWQKGYPSKSECAGQEGQLIPEMHDPLLNDPEVLQ